MQRGRPTAVLIVSPEDTATLRRWASRPKSTNALAMRSRIILNSASGLTNTAIAKRLQVTNATVGKWRSRFIEKGLTGLLDEPCAGAPRSIGNDLVEAVITKTFESTPRDASHWSSRSMARDSGLSASSVRRIWQPFELKPHRSDYFKVSNAHVQLAPERRFYGAVAHLLQPEQLPRLSQEQAESSPL